MEEEEEEEEEDDDDDDDEDGDDDELFIMGVQRRKGNGWGEWVLCFLRVARHGAGGWCARGGGGRVAMVGIWGENGTVSLLLYW